MILSIQMLSIKICMRVFFLCLFFHLFHSFVRWLKDCCPCPVITGTSSWSLTSICCPLPTTPALTTWTGRLLHPGPLALPIPAQVSRTCVPGKRGLSFHETRGAHAAPLPAARAFPLVLWQNPLGIRTGSRHFTIMLLSKSGLVHYRTRESTIFPTTSLPKYQMLTSSLSFIPQCQRACWDRWFRPESRNRALWRKRVAFWTERPWHQGSILSGMRGRCRTFILC